MRRFGVIAALASILAIGLVPALAPVPVLAARPSLTIVSAATYDVRPAEGRVAVSVRLTATNRLRDTVARRFFFRTAFLTVLPGTSGFTITGGNGAPKVSVSKATETYTNLKIDLGANLAAGKSTTLQLTFDLRDAGGAPDRAVRISRSLVTFDVWAFATPETPGSSVAVRFPTGYAVTIGRGPLTGPEPDGTGFERWSSGALEAPLDFIADVAADRPAQYVETSHSVVLADGPATVLLRAWPDDPAWRDRVLGLINRALPILEGDIGLPWPVDGPLTIHEALVSGTGGYAGLFDPAERRIEIAYAASDVVVLHELAHAWFNGQLVADRWAAEAFASYFAELVATELGLDAESPLPVEPGQDAIPLNAWGPSGSETELAETYAYSASLGLARDIAERAGPERLRQVWAMTASGLGAYGANPAAEDAPSGAADWRGLLDLLEEVTAEDFTDLWRAWVARPEDLGLLADRAVARDHYERSAQLAGDWQLSPSIRAAMRAWRFDLARELLGVADSVQGQRATLEAAAAAAGLTLPGTLRESFEGDGGPAAAVAEATAEQATVDAIVAARAARPTADGVGERLLIGLGLFMAQDPESQLAAAEAGLAAGDLEAAYGLAEIAESTWTNAAQAGRSRIVSAALLLLALVLFAGLVRQARHRGSVKPA